MVLSAPNNAKILVRDATKIYETKTGPVHALESFSLDVAEGEFVTLLGPSGLQHCRRQAGAR